jgi:hypothetical protein
VQLGQHVVQRREQDRGGRALANKNARIVWAFVVGQ